MKLAPVLLAVVALSAQAGPCTTHDAWTGPDKTKHFAVGAAIGSGVTLFTKKPEYGFWAGAFVGLGKEVYDRRSAVHTCSLQDFAVTAAGAAAGAYGTAWLIIPQRRGVQFAYVARF